MPESDPPTPGPELQALVAAMGMTGSIVLQKQKGRNWVRQAA
jgi:hypothetical protein